MQSQRTKQVSIHFVSGDETGELTSRLIYAIEKIPDLQYVPDNGAYILEVKLLDEDKEKIGYRYQPHKDVAAKGKIIPSEGRNHALVEVKVLDGTYRKCLLGPAYILGSCEYDHQNDSLNNNINAFSLGQLTDIDTTEDVLYMPLYRNTAEKVALWLQDNLDFINS